VIGPATSQAATRPVDHAPGQGHAPGRTGEMVSSEIVTPAGRPAATEPATPACGDNATTQSCQTYVATLHLRQEMTYQPASRYWPLQWLETAIYLAAALLLSGVCFLWIRRGRPPRGDVAGGPGEAVVLQNSRRPASSRQSA
jgi:hypothetical protein